ncbi:MAG: sugar ABC transporter permease [Desulfobulbaceae bacterium]|nr:sugar ABC transporter permease [Desulfobulbaceae bacterium]
MNLQRRGEELTAWLMAAPAVLGLLTFIALPFIIAVGLSFTRYKLDSPLPICFIGLEQFRRILADEGFRHALANNTLFALIVVPLQTCIALGLAVLLNQPLRGMIVFRALFFMPVIFPMALVSVVWELIFAPGPHGLLNGLLIRLSAGGWQPVDFLHHAGYALPAIMAMSIWQGVGFQMIIILAGLQSIPSALYEAAALDGASRWRQFIHITLPQLRNTLIFVGMVTTILAFRLFDQIWILTQGGPNRATTTIMFETVRSVFKRQDVARGAAMSVVFFLVVLAITLLQRFLAPQERAIEE